MADAAGCAATSSRMVVIQLVVRSSASSPSGGVPVIAGGFGAALVLSAVGAILRYALGWEPAGVDVGIVALILMIVGAAMIFRMLLFVFSARQRPRSMPPPRD